MHQDAPLSVAESILYDIYRDITAQRCPSTHIFKENEEMAKFAFYSCPFLVACFNSFCVLLRYKALDFWKRVTPCRILIEILLMPKCAPQIIFFKVK